MIACPANFSGRRCPVQGQYQKTKFRMYLNINDARRQTEFRKLTENDEPIVQS